jgi:hypothetical protein
MTIIFLLESHVLLLARFFWFGNGRGFSYSILLRAILLSTTRNIRTTMLVTSKTLDRQYYSDLLIEKSQTEARPKISDQKVKMSSEGDSNFRSTSQRFLYLYTDLIALHYQCALQSQLHEIIHSPFKKISPKLAFHPSTPIFISSSFKRQESRSC